MNEKRFEERLRSLLNDDADLVDCFGPDAIREVATFGDAGVMTTNAGLVVEMVDGTTFQLTIVRSRRAPGRAAGDEA